MAVKIERRNLHEIEVNGKEVYKDINGNWIAREELTPAEYKVLREYITASNRKKI